MSDELLDEGDELRYFSDEQNQKIVQSEQISYLRTLFTEYGSNS